MHSQMKKSVGLPNMETLQGTASHIGLHHPPKLQHLHVLMVELLAQQSVLRTHLRKPKLEQARVATSFSESGPESGQAQRE